MNIAPTESKSWREPRPCAFCGAVFSPKSSRHSVCSRNCRNGLDARETWTSGKHWTQRNPEGARAHRRKWDDKNPTAIRDWRAVNPDKVAEYQRRYEASPQGQAVKAVWYESNKDRLIAKAAEYAKTKNGRRCGRVAVIRRRARLRNVEGSFISAEFAAVLAFSQHRCMGCGATGCTLEADHIVPLKHGGTNDIGNIQPLCRGCNARKSARVVDHHRNLHGGFAAEASF